MRLLASLGRFSGVFVALSSLLALPAVALAQDDDISISISKHAELTADGGIIIRVHIACDPLPGIEDFQDAHAGAGQRRTGAGGEAGLDGTVVCDGTAHTHTAHLFPITEAVFKRGPARATASLLICYLIEDEQFCLDGSTQRRVIIRGPVVPRS